MLDLCSFSPAVSLPLSLSLTLPSAFLPFSVSVPLFSLSRVVPFVTCPWLLLQRRLDIVYRVWVTPLTWLPWALMSILLLVCDLVSCPHLMIELVTWHSCLILAFSCQHAPHHRGRCSNPASLWTPPCPSEPSDFFSAHGPSGGHATFPSSPLAAAPVGGPLLCPVPY